MKLPIQNPLAKNAFIFPIGAFITINVKSTKLSRSPFAYRDWISPDSLLSFSDFDRSKVISYSSISLSTKAFGRFDSRATGDLEKWYIVQSYLYLMFNSLLVNFVLWKWCFKTAKMKLKLDVPNVSGTVIS